MDRKKENSVLRHPADTEAWKSFDRKYPDYALEPRNVRLGLASDGFNPFGEKRSTYSTWPVILAAYNLPPWLYMKKEYLMLSMIIPAPKAPGNDINTYLQPLIDDLKELWEDTWCKRYNNSGKCCYLGGRMFLDLDHKYRYDEKSFEKYTKEFRPALIPPSGSEVLERLKIIVFTLGKTTKDEISGVRKMCDNIINTILNVPKKSKDKLKAPCTLEEIGTDFVKYLENVKFPDGYASNISRCVMKRKLLPLAMRESVNEKVSSVLIELCDIFRALCAKNLVVIELEKLQKRMVVTLCNMEKIFPPTFFTIMVHLVVHLSDEAKIGGPIHNRLMYPIEREHVAHIKRFTRRTRSTPIVLDRMHNEEFSDWLKTFVNDPNNQSDVRITDDVRSLAFGPMPIARRFHAFNMNNGYKFRTKEYERNKKTQNSGVMVVEKTQSYASSRDTRPIMGDVTYYGVLTDIIELNYYNTFNIVLFRCNWVDVNHASGMKKDKLNFTLVNLSSSIDSGERLSDEPFVFASQVQQVIYVQDRTQSDWFIPEPIRPRDTFDMGDDSVEQDLSMENEFQASSSEQKNIEIDIDDFTWMLSDVQGINVIVA
ncbi:uncharacterized protein [Spinacia oleracea]|uniref:DUF4218 domain-containing protein n=1 Tax=Spinacia oleracea TaxID=3562 RepID=A0ABM3RID9_SPIOL|nr:uncharacterized protein LOC130469891 [Spinacia oleracea]